MTGIAIAIFLILWLSDAFKTSAYQSQDKAEAIREGRKYYWDNKGNMYSVRTGARIHWHTIYKPIPGSAPGNYYVGQGYINLKTMKLDDVNPYSWREDETVYHPVNEPYLRTAYIDDEIIYY